MTVSGGVPNVGLTLTVTEVELLQQVLGKVLMLEAVVRALVLGADEVTAGHVLTKRHQVVRSRLFDLFPPDVGSRVEGSLEDLVSVKAGLLLDGGRAREVPEIVASRLSSLFIMLDYSFKPDFGRSSRSKGYVTRLVSEFHELFVRKSLSDDDRARAENWKTVVLEFCGELHELVVRADADVVDGLMVRYRKLVHG